MTVMHEAVQDRIRERRLTEVGVPFVDGELAGDQARAGVDAVIEDFQEIGPVLGGQRSKSPVVEHDEGGLGEALQELQVAAVAVRDAQLLDQARQAPVQDRVALATGLLRERFFFNGTATTEIYTLSLHDALPIWGAYLPVQISIDAAPWCRSMARPSADRRDRKSTRLNSSHSSISYAVFCLK